MAPNPTGYLLGDTDDNGTVDGLDQSRLSSDWGSSNPASRADFDGNGVVDGLDQSYLYSHWGEALPSDDALVTFARLESFCSPPAGGMWMGPGGAWRFQLSGRGGDNRPVCGAKAGKCP